jgi:glycine cleavage system H protein
MKTPDDRRYTSSHHWVKSESDGSVIVGITAYAQEQLGDVVYVQQPDIGRKVKRGENCAVVESVKAASDIPAPVSGEIVAVNPALVDAPQKLNEAPYAAWLFRIRPTDAGELDELLDATAYKAATAAL